MLDCLMKRLISLKQNRLNPLTPKADMKNEVEQKCTECGKWMPDDSHLRCADCEDKSIEPVASHYDDCVQCDDFYLKILRNGQDNKAKIPEIAKDISRKLNEWSLLNQIAERYAAICDLKNLKSAELIELNAMRNK